MSTVNVLKYGHITIVVNNSVDECSTTAMIEPYVGTGIKSARAQ